ncbi:heme NO-binding domain-containing protein [Flammeovirgaceae bacterium SG7u.111]|nr:heme NO-binding domain-containing protein [Flammeovirgaceae bacterium SG7u.132]WPO37358.1 heme NO-binding domain-containing protein [Flammeovirgaceae bacterium SG7u.111]
MKSVIPLAIKETYEKYFGSEDWGIVLQKAGFDPKTVFFSHKNTEDKEVMALLKAVMDHKGLTINQLSDVFGDYWVNDFASRHYFAFYQRASSAKDFLMKMNDVHDKIGAKVEGSKPPKFTFNELPDGAMEMGYISERNLIDLVVGLVKGVGKRFGEEIKVTKLSSSLLRLEFLGKIEKEAVGEELKEG